MKRRDFLKLSPAISLPFLLNGIPLTANASNPLFKLLQEQTLNNGKVLVLIQLSGGNDGLNTLIPLDRYSQLMNARQNILIPENRVLPLNNIPQTGFNPAMTGMQSLFNNGRMNIVQAVSYPNPSYSHFRSTDILMTASASNVYLTTGWMGRALDVNFPGIPAAYPSAAMTDPMAVQLGPQSSLSTQCANINPAVTVGDPNAFNNLIEGIVDPTPDTPYGHELTFLRLIKQQTSDYTDIIRNAYNKAGNNIASYDSNNSLAAQLKIVARLIKGGLKTPIYVVSHPTSFDTHGNQVEILDTTVGQHAKLLASVSDAVSSFQQDLEALQVGDRVAAMTFTEFGRRIKSNGSMGTDHGTSTPIFFFGANLNPVIVGTNPEIPQNALISDQVPMQHDFRSVYYTVLKDWFGLTDSQLLSVLSQPYEVLPIFKQQVALPVDLISFTGKWLNSQVTLQWDVDHESGINSYEVQRSADSISFSNIGSVPAVNASGSYTYSFTDKQLTASYYYYRLRIIENGAPLKYSNVLLLKTNQTNGGAGIRVAPNPVSNHFTVMFEDKISGPVSVRLVDLNGKEVWKQERDVSSASNLDFSFANKKPVAGIYVVKLISKSREMSARILVQ